MGELFLDKGTKRSAWPKLVLRRLIAPACLLFALLGPAEAFGQVPAGGEPEVRRFFLTSAVALKEDTLKCIPMQIEDDVPNDTLFQLARQDGVPVAYYRKIAMEVCFDNKCRPLNIRLYWNITGRYLGIELPPEEFLSKSDHDPFTLAEYQRLNHLLADSLSPLGNYTFEQLVPESGTRLFDVDGLTGATAPAMADYVVEGAAYTTLRLWKVAHGPARGEVVRQTDLALSSSLLLEVLQSPDTGDKLWALGRARTFPHDRRELLAAVLELLKDDAAGLAPSVLEAVTAADLEDPDLQLELFSRFGSSGYNLRLLILEKLMEAPSLEQRVAEGLAANLREFQGGLLEKVLKLYEAHKVSAPAVQRSVADLLESKNAFIARMAFRFLEQREIKDPGAAEKLREYRERHAN